MAEQLHAREAPYEEVMEVLAATARAPNADQFMASIIATQLTTMTLHSRGDDEIAAALVEFLGVAGSLPLISRAWKVLSACAGRPRLVARFLPPLIAEMEAAHEPVGSALQCARDVCARLGVALD